MTFRPAFLWKAATHRSTLLLLAGFSTSTFLYALIWLLDSETPLRRLPFWAIFSICGLPFILTTPVTYLLVAGRWTPQRWSRAMIVYFSPVFGCLFAMFTALDPRYSFVNVIIASAGQLLYVGLLSTWRSLYIWLSYAIFFAAFSLLFRGPDGFRLELLQYSTHMGALLFFMVCLSITSRFWAQQTRSFGKLLRTSRKDKRNLAEERRKSERLLLNILPAEIADELKRKGSTEPVHFESATVLFTDFKGFTAVAEAMTAKELVTELDRCFSYFDSLMQRYKLEKLKTIGDAYMCAGGLPSPNNTHAVDCVLAALEIQAFMNQMRDLKKEKGLPYWELRLGIHSGPLVAGVIGEKKFQYDVWGDTVNTASRMESSGATGKVNISGVTFEMVREFFLCEPRGKVLAKNKGEIDMYFVESLLPAMMKDQNPRLPNAVFEARYSQLAQES